MARKQQDIRHNKYNKLRALRPDKDKKYHWIFMCECGKEKSIRSSHVTTGQIQSCGCLLKKKENAIQDNGERRKACGNCMLLLSKDAFYKHKRANGRFTYGAVCKYCRSTESKRDKQIIGEYKKIKPADPLIEEATYQNKIRLDTMWLMNRFQGMYEGIRIEELIHVYPKETIAEMLYFRRASYGVDNRLL